MLPSVLRETDRPRGCYAVCRDRRSCLADEEQRRRPASVASSRFQHAVYEFLPAPWQLVGEKTEAGYTGNERTHEDAVAYAAGRLEARSYVSLGGFGGYLIVGFDHSIARIGKRL